MITYTCKAKLNAHTHRNLAEFLEQQRLLYNGGLQERIDCYQKTGGRIGLYDQRGSLTMIRQSDEWFRKFDRWCQDSALVRVDLAFKGSLSGVMGFRASRRTDAACSSLRPSTRNRLSAASTGSRSSRASVFGTAASPGRGVRQTAGLNGSILEQHWLMFITQLDDKAASTGGQW